MIKPHKLQIIAFGRGKIDAGKIKELELLSKAFSEEYRVELTLIKQSEIEVAPNSPLNRVKVIGTKHKDIHHALNELLVSDKIKRDSSFLIIDLDCRFDLSISPILVEKGERAYNNGIVFPSNHQSANGNVDSAVVFFPDKWFFFISEKVVRNFLYFDVAEANEEFAMKSFALKISAYGFSTVELFSPNWSYELPKEKLLNVGPSDLTIKMLIEQFPYLEGLTDKQLRLGLSNNPNLPSSGESEKKRILYCVHYLENHYNGTSIYALSLLDSFILQFSEKYDITVLIEKDQLEFFELENRYPNRFISLPDLEKLNYSFDLAFIPRQILDIKDLVKIRGAARKIITVVLDIIALRAHYIGLSTYYKDLINLFELSLIFSDTILTISEASKHDIINYFEYIPGIEDKIEVSHLASNIGSEIPNKPEIELPQDYILTIGNPYKHKALEDFALAMQKSDNNLVILGLSSISTTSSKVFTISGGNLHSSERDWLYENAQIVAYPSFYEGYGLPIIEAVEKGKIVLVNNTPVNRELVETDLKEYEDMVIFFDSFDEVVEKATLAIERAKGIDLANAAKSGGLPEWSEVARNTEKVISSTLARSNDNRVEKELIKRSLLDLLDKHLIDDKNSAHLIKFITDSIDKGGLKSRVRSHINQIFDFARFHKQFGTRIVESLKIDFGDPYFKFNLDICKVNDNKISLKGWAFHLLYPDIKIYLIGEGIDKTLINGSMKRQDVFEHFKRHPNALKSGFKTKVDGVEKRAMKKLYLVLSSPKSTKFIPLG